MNLKIQIWLIIFTGTLVWSGINPKDYPVWILEVAPAVIAVIVLGFTFKSYPLTPLLYILVLIHSIILMIGGHYTYAEVPAFDWLKEQLDLTRNHYDKLGHLAQGFVPAIAAREILLRSSPLQQGSWLNFIVICICLAISAFYEMIEWWVALMSTQAADAFLGTQGYIWDTQSDMFFALLGAIAALLILAKLHNTQLEKIS
ncbi:MAG TPA: DUF2238 domain-containing protein [Gammaproteobacteria bacterium]